MVYDFIRRIIIMIRNKLNVKLNMVYFVPLLLAFILSAGFANKASAEAYGFVLKWGALWHFSSPQGVAVDASGKVYVADTYNHRIQKIDSTGEFETTWGSSGSGDGYFSCPNGVAVDASGNVYVADSNNNRIQKFSSAGVFETTWGAFGSGDGYFSYPQGISVDASGNVYVADTYNDRIQKFSSAGVFETTWGASGSGDGYFSYPQGISVDASGNIYVVDSYNHRIQKLNSTGSFETTWGASGSGDGQFYYPYGISVDASGNIYVADTVNDRIQKFDSTGSFETTWGASGSGDGQFGCPRGVAVDASGNVYVADSNNNRIQKFSSAGAFKAAWESEGSEDGQFMSPQGISVDTSGNVYVADSWNNRIQKFSSAGAFETTWGSWGTGDGYFYCPLGVAVDASGKVYVADSDNNRIQKFNSTGAFETTWGSEGSEDGQFEYPSGVAVDASGKVYVADSDNNRIQKFNSTGAFETTWGSEGTGNGQFYGPNGIAVDASGNVYVADKYSHRIQKFGSTGTFEAAWGSEGPEDGQFEYPREVSVDASGNVYVADTDNHRIQKFSSTGVFITKWGLYGDGDGKFKYPIGVSVDVSGNVYVADTWNNRIQKFAIYGFAVSAISGNTSESGVQATFTVKLNNQPTANVTIPVSSSDTSEGIISPENLTFTSANWNINQTVTVTGVDDAIVDGNQNYTIILNAAVSGDANYNGLNPADVSVINIDNDNVIYDTTGPLVTITSPVNNQTVSGIINIEAIINDASTGGSNIVQAAYQIDDSTQVQMYPIDNTWNSPVENVRAQFNTNSISNGLHEIVVKGKDVLNNWSERFSVNIYINNIQTAVPIINSFTGTPNSGHAPLEVDFAVDAQDNDGSIVQYGWDFNGDGIYDTTTFDSTITYTYNILGTYNAKVRVTDDDTAAAYSSVSINILFPNGSPFVSYTAGPSLGRPPLAVNFTANALDTDGSIVSYEWDFDGNGVFDTTIPYNTTSYTYNSAGVYFAKVRVTDDDGATAVGFGNAINVDGIGPMAIITNPMNGQTVSGIININAIISDLPSPVTSNIAGAVYYLDSTGPVSMSAADGSFNSHVENVTAQFNTNIFSNGNHIITVKGKDVFDNWGNLTTVNINVNNTQQYDTTAPVITILNPTNGQSVSGIIEISAKTDDSSTGGTNIASTGFSIDNGPFAPMTPTDGYSYNHSPVEIVNAMLNTNSLSNGAHTLTVRGGDMVPNQNPGITITIYVNTAAPILGNIDTTSSGSSNRIDGHDLYLFSLAFGRAPGSPGWNPICDFNGDSIIDGDDLVVLAANFGKVVTAITGISFIPSGNPINNSVYLSQVSTNNNEITLAVKVKGGINVYGAAIEINFDGSKINYVSAEEGSYLSQGVAGTTAFVAGLAQGNSGVLLIGVNKQGIVPGVNGDGTLAQIVLKALNTQTNTAIVFNAVNNTLKSPTGNISGTAFLGGSLSCQ